MIWTEKYRPSTFQDVIGQEEIIARVKALVEKKNLPHLLFAGPAGVGKSTLALVLAKALFGADWKQNFLELNASDERGIDTVRVKVKDFARSKALGDVPFRIIFLDECDALTREAQQALRRTMENYTNTARFVLSCNFVSKVIEPIQSRCVVFKFKPLSRENIIAMVDKIVAGEGFVMDPAAKEAIVEVSEGDGRRVVNVLQSCSASSKKITADAVYSLSAVAKPAELKEVLTAAISGNFLKARDSLCDLMLNYGISGIDVIKQIQKQVWSLEIDDRKKVAIIEKCGEIEFRMVEGSDEFVQLESLLASIRIL